MNGQIELTTFAIAAIVGLITHLLLDSILIAVIATILAAILIFQVLTHYSPTNFSENSGG